MSRAAVGIRDVARRAEVSPATVSRVLNDDPNVGEQYRRRVLEAVTALDYRPNRLARNLRMQRSATIGVVVSDIENPHFSETVRAVEDLAYQRGYRVLVCNTDESPGKQRAYLGQLTDERVLGVILSPSDPGGAEITEMIDAGIPVVAYDREVEDPRADVVIADNVRAAWAATQLLIDAGHRDIAYVGGRREVETGAERLDGFELTMRAAGLVPRSADGDFKVDRARTAVGALLAEPDRPTALVVGNNLMTIGALGAIRDHAIRVPDDIALVGIDDPFWAEFVDPPLTTVAQPIRRMAADAMELLLDRVAGTRTEPRRIVHDFELRRRVSCGTAARD
ncbi:LacI family DNA-binding transcriptional regulator [Conexibacter woesei]|uniref:Transcriptional regulator, LacI family n=1 Tax=Conexibacter woesei (strain DSM 14684 / CCUG 47730 / CIP 108061 / JCM 11494 / NBRC 100937 / ID131577) TaxID=469383 RepID=D3F3N6_CONWI|nr:LacI family DNA-binding transcriptional regulator [Conexibacter woesei]ADB52401.1 transcriptional regulator, LacI family [Conexibacter woesei DSM 14684]